jgi:uncharacterized membrane protein YgdD (TMEM256/DUF423 family)
MKRMYLYFVSMGLSILLGAWAAHGLANWISESKVDSFKVGVQYQMIHSLALIFLEYLQFAKSHLKQIINRIQFFLVIGMVLFSMSIYLLSLNEKWGIVGMKNLWPLTPIGGGILIFTWFWGAYQFYKYRNEN